MFKWIVKQNPIASNAIYLQDSNGTEGRPFKSRFLQAGLVKYDFGVCLLTKETIDKFINTFINVPVIINHKDNINPDDEVGKIQNVWFSSEDGWFWCDGIITDKKAIELIENGYNVSCQYRITDYSDNLENKLHNGNPYDKEILNGVFEHLAIVKNPRYEGAFIAANAYIAKNNKFKEQDHPRDEEGKFVDGGSSKANETIEGWGNSYPEFSGRPTEAIEHLLKNKDGYVPAAISKDGIGDIDFVYGATGKKGFGLAHIIEQRNKQGIDGNQFVKTLPELINAGEVISKDGHPDRKYIISDDKEVAIRLDFNGYKQNWVLSAYMTKELQGSNSLDDWHTMLALDSNLSVANGCVSIATPTNNIISNNIDDFNPTDFINELDKGGQMDEKLKELCAGFAKALLKAKNEADEEKEKETKEKEEEAKNKAKNQDEEEKDKDKASNEDTDKRKLIDEIGGILKDKVDEELWRTVIGKAEKLAYTKSEAGTADNKAKNNCKNENETKEGEYEKLKEEIYEEVENQIAKNSLDSLKSAFYEGSVSKKKLYMSQNEGIELGKALY